MPRHILLIEVFIFIGSINDAPCYYPNSRSTSYRCNGAACTREEWDPSVTQGFDAVSPRSKAVCERNLLKNVQSGAEMGAGMRIAYSWNIRWPRHVKCFLGTSTRRWRSSNWHQYASEGGQSAERSENRTCESIATGVFGDFCTFLSSGPPHRPDNHVCPFQSGGAVANCPNISCLSSSLFLTIIFIQGLIIVVMVYVRWVQKNSYFLYVLSTGIVVALPYCP